MLFGKDTEELKAKLADTDVRLLNIVNLITTLDEKQDKRMTMLEGAIGKLSLTITLELLKLPEHLTAVAHARDEVEKSTRSFTELQRRIEQFITQKIGDAIKESVNTLQVDTDRYAFVKKEIETLVGSAKQFTDEAAKFAKIAERIEKADLDLVKHARELARTDAEKVKLMKEVDDLQRMVGKMRRNT